MSDAFQTHAAFCWNELRTGDVAAAKAFYRDVIGWTMEEMDTPNGPYTVLKAGDQPVGGIMANPAAGTPAHWHSYVTADDVDKRVDKAQSAGAKVVMPAMDAPGVGRMAAVQDPTGAVVSFITYERKD